MKKATVYVLAVAALLAPAIASAAVDGLPGLVPRTVLFGNPEKVMPDLSPDGKKMAYVAPLNGVLNVWVKTIGADDDYPVTADTGNGIMSFLWSADSKRIIYMQDQAGNENYRVYGVDLKSDKVIDYTPFEDVRAMIMGYNDETANKIIIAMNKRTPYLFDLYELNLKNGKLKQILENPGDQMGWIFDKKLRVRGYLSMNAEGGNEIYMKKEGSDQFELIASCDVEDECGVVNATEDGKYLYLKDSRNFNSARLVKLNVETGETEVIAEDPNYDIGGVMFEPETEKVLWYTVQRDRKERILIDEEFKEDFDYLYSLEEGELGITDYTKDLNVWLLAYIKDDGPVKYYYYDRTNKKATFMFDHRPELNDYQLAKMEPISFQARDGMTIHGYITFPVGVERENLPMVVNVHGGPWVREYWGYTPEAQWLANRGYICLQINYRGSAGYGKEYLNAGNKEWGRKMHYDLIDGVEWAVDQGYADPEKVAIYGGSYGGYAALVGATFTPDVFCCAIDMCGPSNLITFLETVPPYWKPGQVKSYKRVGHPVDDAEMLKERSPLFKVDEIKIPMIVAHGSNDPRVKQTEADQVVEAMKEKGIDYQYLVFEDEGHGLAKEENRFEFYAAVEKFLAQHMGGRYEE